MRKMLSLAMAALVAVGMYSSPAAAEDVNILMVQWRGLTESEKAFKARLTELGVNANITEVDANQDRANLASKMRELEGDIAAGKFKLAYTHGTTASQVALSIIRDRIPTVFNIVFDPVGGKLVNDVKNPGGTVTGATNGVPIEDQFDAFQRLSPIKKLIVLFNSREGNANSNEKAVSDWAQKNNIELVSLRVAPGTDSLDTILADIQSGKITGDALYAGADSYLSTQAGKIHEAIGSKVKLFGGTQTFVLRGWLAAYAPTVLDLGHSVAEITARILKGEAPGSIPVALPQPKIIVSASAASVHGVATPDGAVMEK